MTDIIFLACALMSAVCSLALIRGYLQSRKALLFWSSLCFALLAFDNIFLCVDLIAYPSVDLHGPLVRNILSALAGTVLVFGLIVELP